MTNDKTIDSQRIIRDPSVLVGKPVIMGTRIPVELVLEHLSQNPDLHELFAAYPRLTIDDIKACFAYARDLVAAEQHAKGSALRGRGPTAV